MRSLNYDAQTKPNVHGSLFRAWVIVSYGLLMGLPSRGFADWPLAAGPKHNYQTSGNAPKSFSVARNQSIRWRVPLPNTGESTPVVADGKVFLTCHAPMSADSMPGREIYGMCFDAETGEELWRRELPATRLTDMASGFSDNTAATPVTDGKYVCFVNVGGSIQTYDHSGQLIWQKTWVPFGRHHARQQEPLLHDGKVIILRTVAEDLPVKATTKAGAKPLGRGEEFWTRLHAYEISTGKLNWIAEAGSSVHSLSMIQEIKDGEYAILTGRGGGHQPPEEPYGLSLLRADTGENLWESSIPSYHAHQNAVWNRRFAAAFLGMQHQTIDINTGDLLSDISLSRDVTLCRYNPELKRYLTEKQIDLDFGKKTRPTTYHTNCLVENFHFFRAHSQYLIGRVDLVNEKVEYLQVPVQVVREDSNDTVRWNQALENDVRNQDGFLVYQDKRSTLDGWGHVSAASPIVVGDYLYMPTMIGTVYVIRWNSPELNDESIVSISDLGHAGRTWSLSSMAYSKGRLYARTMKELICITE